MGSGLLSAGLRCFHTFHSARSVSCLCPSVQALRKCKRVTVAQQHRRLAHLNSATGLSPASLGPQPPSLQLRRRLNVATGLHSFRTAAVVAAGSPAPMQRKVSHILLKADEAELMDEIEEKIKAFMYITQQHSADGEDFKMLAAEYSNCGSSVKGGLVGWIEKGRTALTFEEAVYEADMGELVRAETQYGLHLIRVEAERKQAGIVQMPVTELASILQDPQLAAQHQFVDVREPAEEDIARIKQFQLFPLSKLREWGPSLKKNLDPAKPTIVMCHHGVRSQQAAQYLESEGFAQLSNVKGGIHEYSVVADHSVPVY